MPSYRIRRGKKVEIPPEWVGKTVDPQTIRKRRSKLGKQARAMQSHPSKSGDYFTKHYRQLKRDGVQANGEQP